MKKYSPNVFKFLASRFARNFYFWFCYQWVTYAYLHDSFMYPTKWYYLFRAINLVLMLCLIYTNNFLLIPKLLHKGRIAAYVFVVLLLTITVSVIYNVDMKIMQQHFPEIKVYEVSSLSGNVSQSWSLKGVVLEAHPYFAGLAILVFCFSMAWYMNDYARQRGLALLASKKRTETELSFLKNQINPHFLFNTMNNLYSMTLSDPKHASEIILKLSSILRYMLYETNVEKVHFSKEKEIMESYIELELMRLKTINNLQFSIHSDADYRIPPLLWAPILENIFKYGTSFIADEYEIKFRFSIVNNMLHIYSSNKYHKAQNITGSATRVDKGIGLENLKKRLVLLYPDKHSFFSGGAQNYYITEIKIGLA